MLDDHSKELESTLDSTGPWAVWVGIAILLVLSVGVMLDHSIGIQDTPRSVAAAPPPAHP
jgi:hypothetical protein